MQTSFAKHIGKVYYIYTVSVKELSIRKPNKIIEITRCP